jgi:hypothetical protein
VATRARSLLFALLGLMLAYAVLSGATDALQTKVAMLPLRRAFAFPVALADNPVGYWVIVFGLSVLGLASAAFAMRLLWAVASPSSAQNHRLMATVLSRSEEAAPSGLRPLWVALAVVGCCIALYVALS